MLLTRLGLTSGLLLSIPAALPVDAQVLDRRLIPRPRPAGEQAVVALENLPAEMVRMHVGDGWQQPSRTPGPRVGVTRTAPALQVCRQPADLVDLRRVRANGFAVISYTLDQAPGPRGFTQAAEAVLRPYRRDGERLINAKIPAEIDVFSVSPGPWVLDVPVRGAMKRLGCQATWRLAITLVGPKGVDPVTGRRR